MRWHLRCGKCYRRCTTCFFYCRKISIRSIDTNRNSSASPCNPRSTKIGRRVCGTDAHINTANRIYRRSQTLNIIFQQFPIHFYIPIFGNFKHIIVLCNFPDCDPFTSSFKVHNYRCSRNNILYGYRGKCISQSIFDIVGSFCRNCSSTKYHCCSRRKSDPCRSPGCR